MKLSIQCILVSGAVALTACGQPEAPPGESQIDSASAAVQEDANTASSGFPDRLLWGDTHLHTTDSPDAFGWGARLGAEDALRFARGELITATSGVPAQLSRPLDFLVISDHAVGLGISREIYEGNPLLLDDPRVNRWHEMMQEGPEAAAQVTQEMIDGHLAGTNPPALSNPEIALPIIRDIWQARGHVVERYNEPGVFTAFIGYEFTPTPQGNNLHRVVVFRDGIEKTNTILPFSSSVSEDPEDLWAALDQYEKNTGGKVLAISHNSNISNGQMFAFADFEGNPIDAEYARTRIRWEPLVEVTQIKGDSESHPFLSPNDEFAAYGDAGWERGNLNLTGLKTDDMLAGEYVREALKRGFAIEAETGVNPYKLGMIGSTDSHTGLATADSDNFFGKHSGLETGPDRATYTDALVRDGLRFGWHYLASGYAAVWAEENSREAIFDAMMRREVYATTGPRIALRFFGGWRFDDNDADSKHLTEQGYAKGVPMGADLPDRVENAVPSFLLSALMDPDGANLDRVQIIKGWQDASGDLHERIFDVMWSGDREPGADGRLPVVGNTVDLSVPSYSNTIGTAELTGRWTDPDFDPAAAAFYYVRVLEIPTPRWPAYDAVRFNAELPDDTQLITQERAYSSPIWYTPPAE